MESNEVEVMRFVNQVFNNCDIRAKYYPDETAWKFELTARTICNTFTIRPPKGFCMLQVQSIAGSISFQMVLFVEDFKKYHIENVLN